MMVSRGLFGWSRPHVQSLTSVSEVSEPPESPSLYMDPGVDVVPSEDEKPVDDVEEMEPPPAAVPFSRLFACANGLDWFLMTFGALAAPTHGMSLVIYLHFFGRSINLHSPSNLRDKSSEEVFHEYKQDELSSIREESSSTLKQGVGDHIDNICLSSTTAFTNMNGKLYHPVGNPDSTSRTIKKARLMKRSKNLRKQKAIERAISKGEKMEEKACKMKSKVLRVQSAKSLYE